MTSQPDSTPSSVETDIPNVARVYDYYLGGAYNFQADRDFATKILTNFPEARDFARHNRRYQNRAVRHVSEQGVRQFLDLGAGIPTVGPTHEIARQVNPDAKVAYVDIEALAVTQSRHLLAGDTSAEMIEADLRDVDGVLRAASALLDFDQPVAVMILAMLHFLSDEDDPSEVIARYGDALAPGSYMIISHATEEGPVGERVRAAASSYAETSLPGHLRNREQVAELMRPFELIEPGVVWTPQWRPESAEQAKNPENAVAYAAVGRKR
ncbi:MAG: SAM-dependent methyltransferase [Sciscionella sp.]